MISSLQHSSGSYELVVGAVIAGLVGFAMDTVLGTRPWFTVLFAAAGMTGAAVSIIFSYRVRMKAASADRLNRRNRGLDL